MINNNSSDVVHKSSSNTTQKFQFKCISVFIASFIQITLLLSIFKPNTASYLLLILLILSNGYILSTNKKQQSTALIVSLLIFTIGGLGMLIGSIIDLILAGKEGLFAIQQISIDMTHAHHHGSSSHLNYMMLVMLIFCVPSCIIFCSSHRHSGIWKLEFWRHILLTIVMVLSMLFMPAFIIEFASILSPSFISISTVKALFSSFSSHHLLMLLCMSIGAFSGYKLYNLCAYLLLINSKKYKPKIDQLISRL